MFILPLYSILVMFSSSLSFLFFLISFILPFKHSPTRSVNLTRIPMLVKDTWCLVPRVQEMLSQERGTSITTLHPTNFYYQTDSFPATSSKKLLSMAHHTSNPLIHPTTRQPHDLFYIDGGDLSHCHSHSQENSSLSFYFLYITYKPQIETIAKDNGN